MKKKTVAGISALAVLVSAASAATISDNATFTNLSVGSGPAVVTLDKFNPSLGTLTKVELRLDTTTTNSSLTFDNESFNFPPGTSGTFGSQPVTLGLGTRIQAQTGIRPGDTVQTYTYSFSSTFRTATIANDTDLPNIPNGDPTGKPNFLGGDSISLLPTTTVTSFGLNTFTSANDLKLFTAGSGSLTFPVAISGIFSSPGVLKVNPSNIQGAFSTPSQNFSGKLTATYTYTLAAVPEASTLLFGAALGLGMAFRRFRTQLA